MGAAQANLAATGPRPAGWSRLNAALAPWLLPIFLLLAWEVSARTGWLSSRILPEPLAVATQTRPDFRRGPARGEHLMALRRR